MGCWHGLSEEIHLVDDGDQREAVWGNGMWILRKWWPLMSPKGVGLGSENQSVHCLMLKVPTIFPAHLLILNL